jgi:tryptophan-rich sensory protein
MKNILKLTLCITIPLFIGAISGIATASGIDTWYVDLTKPTFNPPNYLFGPVWTTLYILMGISFFGILKSPKTELRKKAIMIFCIQLFLNFCWSFLFFNFQLLGLAFIEIIFIWVSIVMMIILYFEINKTAAILQIPYLLWVSFASILNGSIWFLN